MTDRDAFADRWRLWARSCGFNDGPSEHWLAELSAAYSGPNRHYHSKAHILDLLTKLDGLAGKFGNTNDVIAAIYFHDVIYDVMASDNEVRSAELARTALLQLSFDESGIERVVDLVKATAEHTATPDFETNLFVDMDMSILAAERDLYQAYAEAVMAEYTSVFPREAYIQGRKSLFLNPVLERGTVFLTPEFGANESSALENMAWELKWLGG